MSGCESDDYPHPSAAASLPIVLLRGAEWGELVGGDRRTRIDGEGLERGFWFQTLWAWVGFPWAELLNVLQWEGAGVSDWAVGLRLNGKWDLKESWPGQLLMDPVVL